MNIVVRPASQADANAVAHVYLASRRTFIPFAPLTHSDEQVSSWIANLLLPSGAVSVAVVNDTAGGEMIVGMMATSREGGIGWVDHLYLSPGFTGVGIGSLLLAQAKSDIGPPICLYTFQANTGARRFYERHGFVAVELSDGQGNEEKCPDVLYQWTNIT